MESILKKIEEGDTGQVASEKITFNDDYNYSSRRAADYRIVDGHAGSSSTNSFIKELFIDLLPEYTPSGYFVIYRLFRTYAANERVYNIHVHPTDGKGGVITAQYAILQYDPREYRGGLMLPTGVYYVGGADLQFSVTAAVDLTQFPSNTPPTMDTNMIDDRCFDLRTCPFIFAQKAGLSDSAKVLNNALLIERAVVGQDPYTGENAGKTLNASGSIVNSQYSNLTDYLPVVPGSTITLVQSPYPNTSAYTATVSAFNDKKIGLGKIAGVTAVASQDIVLPKNCYYIVMQKHTLVNGVISQGINYTLPLRTVFLENAGGNLSFNISKIIADIGLLKMK